MQKREKHHENTIFESGCKSRKVSISNYENYAYTKRRWRELDADLRHYLDAASRMENVIGEGARECVNKMLIVIVASINYTLRAKDIDPSS